MRPAAPVSVLAWRMRVYRHRTGNGSKAFGLTLWFNTVRMGLEVRFWVWEIQLIKEKR